jgi:hypothetical protein
MCTWSRATCTDEKLRACGLSKVCVMLATLFGSSCPHHFFVPIVAQFQNRFINTAEQCVPGAGSLLATGGKAEYQVVSEQGTVLLGMEFERDLASLDGPMAQLFSEMFSKRPASALSLAHMLAGAHVANIETVYSHAGAETPLPIFCFLTDCTKFYFLRYQPVDAINAEAIGTFSHITTVAVPVAQRKGGAGGYDPWFVLLWLRSATLTFAQSSILFFNPHRSVD